MKNLLLLFLVLFSFSFYGQSYTEKYNSVYERYEYYNSNNELVGYKKYDPVYEEWKYTDLTQQRQQRKSPYADMEPGDTFNEGLAYKVLAGKQARYDANVQDVRNHLEQLQSQFRQYGDYEKQEKALDMFAEVITAFNNNSNNNMVDFSSNNITVDVKNYFTREYNRIINYVNSISDTKTYTDSYQNSTKNRTSSTSFETRFISESIDIFLREEPNVMSKEVYKCPKNAVVKVIDTSNEKYYKVIVNGYSGYVRSGFLKSTYK
jgi:hypothetical protein